MNIEYQVIEDLRKKIKSLRDQAVTLENDCTYLMLFEETLPEGFRYGVYTSSGGKDSYGHEVADELKSGLFIQDRPDFRSACRANVRKYGSIEATVRALQSNVDCEDLTNCTNMYDAFQCWNQDGNPEDMPKEYRHLLYKENGND